MDNKIMYFSTVYSKDGRRLAFGPITNNLEDASIQGRAGAIFFGDGATYKVAVAPRNSPWRYYMMSPAIPVCGNFPQKESKLG